MVHLKKKPEYEEIHEYGWKGKDKIRIVPHGVDFKYTEHRKNKETQIVKKHSHIVTRYNVVVLWNIIRQLLPLGEKWRSRDIIPHLIERHELCELEQVSMEMMKQKFSGLGHNRTDFYFPLYYYPIKIIAAKKYADYTSSGVTTRLSDEWAFM